MKSMEREKVNLLVRAALEAGYDIKSKTAFDILGNSYWTNLLETASMALSVVALGSGDYKLAGILALLKSWLADKRKEKEEQERLEAEMEEHVSLSFGDYTYY